MTNNLNDRTTAVMNKGKFMSFIEVRYIRCQRCGHAYPETYGYCPMANCGTPKLKY